MRKIIFLLALLCANSKVINAQSTFLVSGEPIKNGSVSGIGNFTVPSLTGIVMGTAKVNDDQYPDLFMQADIRQPGTFLYHLKKFTRSEDVV